MRKDASSDDSGWYLLSASSNSPWHQSVDDVTTDRNGEIDFEFSVKMGDAPPSCLQLPLDSHFAITSRGLKTAASSQQIRGSLHKL
jgi:hypothetical protein